MRASSLPLKIAALATVAALSAAPAYAQSETQTSPAAASSASAQPSFEDLVDQDVAAGYYSRGQGDALKADYQSATDRLQTSYDSLGKNMDKTVGLFVSNDQTQAALTQISDISDANGGDAHEQAVGIYNLMDKSVQLQRSMLDNITPTLQAIFDEIDGLAARRAQLIAANPNVPPAVKHTVQKQSAGIHDVSQRGAESLLGAEKAKLTAIQDDLENNKATYVGRIEKTMGDLAKTYGPDKSKWPKSPPPAAKPPPKPAPPGPPQTPDQTVATNTPTGHTPTTRGTIPGQPDPSLRVPSNTGNPIPGKPVPGKPTPGSQGSNGSTNDAKGSSPAKRPSRLPPPPPPDPLQVKKTQLHDLPVVQPPSQNPSPQDRPAYTYNAPPAPPGNGGNVTDQTPPPTPQGPVVIAPSTRDSNDLPPPTNVPPPPSNSTPPTKPRVGTNPNTQMTEANDPSLDAYRNNPDARNQPPPTPAPPTPNPTAPSSNGADAVGAAVGAASQYADSTVPNTSPPADPNAPPPPPAQPDLSQILRPGRIHIVEGEDALDPIGMLQGVQLPSLAGAFDDMDQGVEYGDTITSAALQPIYAGYSLSDNTGDAMMSLDLHAPAPSAVMTVPSNQILVPSSVMTVPSNQLTVPSPVMTTGTPQGPTAQPHSASSDEPDPELCGQ